MLIGGAALAVLAVVGLAVSAGGEDQRAGPRFVTLTPVPPVPNLPVGVPSASRPPSRAPAPPAKPPTADRTRRTPPLATEPVSSRAATKPAPSPSPAAFVSGTTIGLSPAGKPGSRVRHQNFRARIDRIGAGSTDLERADSRFVVRSAPAGAGCIVFEAANYPGYFLRHRDFRIYLDRMEFSAQFAADATFCPVARDGGQVLAAGNYPRLFITQRESELILGAQPTVFTIREPL
ncbi:MAG: AbfB domain-containing protein [Actinoplanes sp.]